MTTTDAQGHQHHGPSEFRIFIDRSQYVVTEDRMTGTELRQVPSTPIGPERDLFEVVPGGPDRKIEDTEIVEIRNGKRFFTAPSHINPGSGREVEVQRHATAYR